MKNCLRRGQIANSRVKMGPANKGVSVVFHSHFPTVSFHNRVCGQNLKVIGLRKFTRRGGRWRRRELVGTIHELPLPMLMTPMFKRVRTRERPARQSVFRRDLLVRSLVTGGTCLSRPLFHVGSSIPFHRARQACPSGLHLHWTKAQSGDTVGFQTFLRIAHPNQAKSWTC